MTIKLLKTRLRLRSHIVTMAVTRTPTKKAMRTKMTNSEVVKEVVQEVQAELSTGRVVVTLPSLCRSTVSLYAETCTNCLQYHGRGRQFSLMTELFDETMTVVLCCV